MFSVLGKCVLITGGSSGIGAGLARRLAKAGARVVVIDLNAPPTDLTDMGVQTVRCDVSAEQEFRAGLASAAELLGGSMDAIVNNAGIGPVGPSISDSSTTDFQRVMAVNFYSVYYGLKYGANYIPHGGSIVSTASLAATIALPGFSQYAASKAGVVQLTKSAALELGARGIRVNAVSPTVIPTPMLTGDEDTIDLSALAAPLGRVCQVDDLLGLYHFLISDDSRFISGQVIAVDGGWTAGMSQRLMDRLK